MDLQKGNPGNADLTASGSKVYALSPGLSEGSTVVVVLDVCEGPGTARQIQTFRPKGLGVDSSAGGLAWYG